MSGVGRGAHAMPSGGQALDERHVRRQWTLPLFASLASLAVVLVLIVSPTDASSAMAMAPADSARAAAAPPAPAMARAGQSFAVDGDYDRSATRDAFEVTRRAPAASHSAGAPPAGRPDPGTAKAIAYDMVLARGWGEAQYDCLVSLWNRESGWNVYAQNPSSGAYGIPQALPGTKMASAGADWRTNPRTQIEWGLGYIAGRYGTPCGAWQSSQTRGWY